MEIHEILIRAKNDVEQAELPEALVPIAFTKAVEHLMALALAAQGLSPEKTTFKPLATAESETLLAKIASQLKLGMETVTEVYEEDEESGLIVIVGAGRLNSGKAQGTRQLALLVAGGRQLAELEGWTDTGEIRRSCEAYGKFDSANFAATIGNMEKVFNFRGQGRQRKVRLNRVGEEQLKRLVEEL